MADKKNNGRNSNSVLLTKLQKSTGKKSVEALEELFKMLKKLPQDIDTKELYPFFKLIVSSSNLHHKNQDIRLLSCCCIVESLRLCAPNSPFDNQQMIDIFTVIIDSFPYLKDSSQEFVYQSTYYILRSLSEVRSCCAIVELPNGGLDLIIKLFQAFYNVAHIVPEMGIFDCMTKIQCYMIQELDRVPQELLDIIGLHLLTKEKEENNGCYQLSFNVFQADQSIISPYVTDFIHGYISTGGNDIERSSELIDNLQDFLFNLHLASPSYLSELFPLLTSQISLDSPVLRKQYIMLLSNLFISTNASYIDQFHKEFLVYTTRFIDKETDIREHMITTASSIIEAHSSSANDLLPHLILRLKDTSPDIRGVTLDVLYTICISKIDLFQSQDIQAIEERCIDKIVKIRIKAITVLSKIYSSYILVYLSRDEIPPTSLSNKLNSIPNCILHAYIQNNPLIKERVLKIFEDILIDKEVNEEIRNKEFLYLYSLLDDQSYSILSKYIIEKKKYKDIMMKYIRAKQNSEKLERSLLIEMRQLFNVTDKNIDILLNNKETIYTHIIDLCEENNDYESIQSIKTIILSEYSEQYQQPMKILLRYLSSPIFLPSLFPAILKYIETQMNTITKQFFINLQTLLLLLLDCCAPSFSVSLPLYSSLLTICSNENTKPFYSNTLYDIILDVLFVHLKHSSSESRDIEFFRMTDQLFSIIQINTNIDHIKVAFKILTYIYIHILPVTLLSCSKSRTKKSIALKRVIETFSSSYEKLLCSEQELSDSLTPFNEKCLVTLTLLDVRVKNNVKLTDSFINTLLNSINTNILLLYDEHKSILTESDILDIHTNAILISIYIYYHYMKTHLPPYMDDDHCVTFMSYLLYIIVHKGVLYDNMAISSRKDLLYQAYRVLIKLLPVNKFDVYLYTSNYYYYCINMECLTIAQKSNLAEYIYTYTMKKHLFYKYSLPLYLLSLSTTSISSIATTFIKKIYRINQLFYKKIKSESLSMDPRVERFLPELVFLYFIYIYIYMPKTKSDNMNKDLLLILDSLFSVDDNNMSILININRTLHNYIPIPPSTNQNRVQVTEMYKYDIPLDTLSASSDLSYYNSLLSFLDEYIHKRANIRESLYNYTTNIPIPLTLYHLKTTQNNNLPRISLSPIKPIQHTAKEVLSNMNISSIDYNNTNNNIDNDITHNNNNSIDNNNDNNNNNNNNNNDNDSMYITDMPSFEDTIKTEDSMINTLNTSISTLKKRNYNENTSISLLHTMSTPSTSSSNKTKTRQTNSIKRNISSITMKLFSDSASRDSSPITFDTVNKRQRLSKDIDVDNTSITTTSATTTDSNTNEKISKKRGRSRNSTTTTDVMSNDKIPKKRGRSSTKTSISTESNEELSKKRGRSSTKTLSSNESNEESSKKRGRSSSTVATSKVIPIDKIPKKRGRPSTTSEVMSNDTDEKNNQKVMSNDTDEKNNQKVPKRRGRKPRVLDDEIDNKKTKQNTRMSIKMKEIKTKHIKEKKRNNKNNNENETNNENENNNENEEDMKESLSKLSIISKQQPKGRRRTKTISLKTNKNKEIIQSDIESISSESVSKQTKRKQSKSQTSISVTPTKTKVDMKNTKTQKIRKCRISSLSSSSSSSKKSKESTQSINKKVTPKKQTQNTLKLKSFGIKRKMKK